MAKPKPAKAASAATWPDDVAPAQETSARRGLKPGSKEELAAIQHQRAEHARRVQIGKLARRYRAVAELEREVRDLRRQLGMPVEV